MLVAIALLTTVALLVKTAAERWLATPVDAGPLQLRAGRRSPDNGPVRIVDGAVFLQEASVSNCRSTYGKMPLAR